jgi:nitroreductase
MDVRQAITNRRSIRRFTTQPVTREALTELVSLARLYASGANHQPLRFAAVENQKLCDLIFETLKWAAYLPDFTIGAQQKPTAYVVITGSAQTKKNRQFDVGAASTTLMLAAQEQGIASCCLASFDAAAVKELLNLGEDTEPILVIALGYPDQHSVAVDFAGDIKYYEDGDGLCVPKLTTEQVLTLY